MSEGRQSELIPQSSWSVVVDDGLTTGHWIMMWSILCCVLLSLCIVWCFCLCFDLGLFVTVIIPPCPLVSTTTTFSFLQCLPFPGRCPPGHVGGHAGVVLWCLCFCFSLGVGVAVVLSTYSLICTTTTFSTMAMAHSFLTI